jgi:hypothetical protein
MNNYGLLTSFISVFLYRKLLFSKTCCKGNGEQNSMKLREYYDIDLLIIILLTSSISVFLYRKLENAFIHKGRRRTCH